MTPKPPLTPVSFVWVATEILLAAALALLLAAAGVWLGYQVAAIGFPYQLDYGEAPLVDQAVRLVAGETIYAPDLTAPPYTISNYPPLYITALALFVPVTGPAFWPGRLLSASGALMAALLVGLILRDLTKDRIAALIGGLLVLGWPYVILWSTLARIDLPALALSLGGLWVLARRPTARWSLWVGGALLVAAIYTRQSYALAAPAAGFVWIWSVCGLRRALGLAAWVGGLAGVLFVILNLMTGGGFFLHIVTANVNAFSWDTVRYHAGNVWSLAGILVTLGLGSLAVVRRWNPTYALAATYLIGATLSALTIGKIGSNVNYLLELCAALALAAGALTAAARANGPKTLGQPVLYAAFVMQAIAFMQGALFAYPGELPGRLPERQALSRLAELVAATDGPVLADEQMGMVTLAGKRLALQPFELTQLAASGVWDQRPLLESIESGDFDLIIHYDVPWLKERWSPEMFAAIERGYRLTDVIANNRIYRPYRASAVGGQLHCPGAPWALPTITDLGLKWDGAALTLFGRGGDGDLAVLAVAEGQVALDPEHPDRIAIRYADPLNPGSRVWMIIDGLADGTGGLSYVSEALKSGVSVGHGTELGAQGSWSGRPMFPMWVHARVMLVRPGSGGELPEPPTPDQILDPRPYFGLVLSEPGDQPGPQPVACAQP